VAFQAEMALQTEVQPVLLDVRQFFSASSVSADVFLYHLCMEGSQPYDFYEPLPGVVPS